MKYQSTRGDSNLLSFEQAVLRGLAPDGGLYIPVEIPLVTTETLNHWSKLSFVDLAFEIFRLYIDSNEICDADLKEIVAKSFSTFTSDKVVPIKQVDDLHILELFHGPTFAFKDVALQFLGNLFEYFLARINDVQLTVVGATSGDTGGAAIYGLRGKKNIQVFILHPKGRVSSVQELQMATVLDPNVHNLAIQGTFDDCQDIVKALFSEESFRSHYNLGAINSINWARILAQISYYFYSRLQFDGAVQYSVPTGNFGDILAGFYAKQMGLEISNLIIATNENDILHRFLQTGCYDKGHVKQTLSPAMDILVSSNFERVLWYFSTGKTRYNNVTAEEYEQASQKIKSFMKQLSETGKFTADKEIWEKCKMYFKSHRASDEETSNEISKYYHKCKYVLDPHTAVGVIAAHKYSNPSIQSIVLATASPGKFPEAVLTAINKDNNYLNFKDFAPIQLQNLDQLPKRIVTVNGKNHQELKERVKLAIKSTLLK